MKVPQLGLFADVFGYLVIIEVSMILRVPLAMLKHAVALLQSAR